ncbi:phospholipid/cholesterol/gamma-HCH transport system substrate-binding protein [Nocardia amikacinitolerans]|uniref:MCE family protein n=1 Tax=Nocardia amikacinitolerans TaxID=756689 RepID=UPI0008363AB8|nr:MCE family protein [Nocardia amikacinitolerans]MCP2315993.1 phospholipid/cholesterol/gamma-HCH transport system substrate-binding protein [Nocardia amikacinitolerans]
MKSTVGVIFRLALFAAVMVVLLTTVVTAIERPVAGSADAFRVMFTDANGLKPGDDVRMYGVQVGKVQAIALDQGRAAVEISVQRDHPVFETSVFAIRYQTLTGQRYVDLRQPAAPGIRLAAGATVAPERTIPSFDITTLFNGLQPVLRDFSPSALNQLSESVLAVIQGNGTGLGPALEAVEQLSRYAVDRQAVISTLVRNLHALDDRLGGKSPYLDTLIQGLTNLFTVLEDKLKGLVDYALAAPPVLGPLDDLLATLGLTPDSNPDLENALRAAFPDPQAATEVLGKLPGLLQGLEAMLPGVAPEMTVTCSNGNAPVPPQLRVFIGGQRIVLCNR